MLCFVWGVSTYCMNIDMAYVWGVQGRSCSANAVQMPPNHRKMLNVEDSVNKNLPMVFKILTLESNVWVKNMHICLVKLIVKWSKPCLCIWLLKCIQQKELNLVLLFCDSCKAYWGFVHWGELWLMFAVRSRTAPASPVTQPRYRTAPTSPVMFQSVLKVPPLSPKSTHRALGKAAFTFNACFLCRAAKG